MRLVNNSNNPATPTQPDTLAQPIPGHTTPTPSDGAPVTPCDNAVVASRDNNGASVTLRENAVVALCDNNRVSVTSRNNTVVASRDNDPAIPAHLDVLAQPLPGHTTSIPSGEPPVTSCDNAVVASRDNPATVPPHDNASFGGEFRFFGRARTR